MRRLRLAAFAIGLLPGLLALGGCGGDSTVPAIVFKSPNYAYLTKLRLNVGDIRIEDHVPPTADPSDLAAQAPIAPEQAMRQMAQDRLVAAGSSGTAVFTIDQASITGQPGGALNGVLAAHIDIIGAKGGHNGYAEAHVSRQFVPGSDTDNDGLKGQLYTLTNQMMSDMNVEFEYQLRRTLGDWLLDAAGTPVGATVDQQPLPPPGAPTSPPTPASVGAPMQLAPPPAASTAGPTDPAPAPPVQMSPPAGFLRLPNGDLATMPVSGTTPSAAMPAMGQPSGY